MCTLLTQNNCLVCHTQDLSLSFNKVGNAGLTALAKAVESGALAALEFLDLERNAIGDAGISALATALTPDKDGKGALASLKTLHVNDGPLGTEHPALTAACEARGIELP